MLHLFILLCYGLGIAAVHTVHYVLKQRPGEQTATRHYLIICHHHQQQIEWLLRMLSFWSWLYGHSIRITVLDQGSADDTMLILERVARRQPIQMMAGPVADIKAWDGPDTQTIVFDLNQIPDVRKLALT